jgi:hypothetical protein
VVGPHGRLWRPGPAVSNHRPMPKRRLRLAGDRVLPMQDEGEPAVECYPQSARDTPIWKLEPSFRCRSCGTRRYKPPVRMIKLTEQREIAPYKWVHPDEEP